MALVYRIIEMDPPHNTGEAVETSPAEALRQYGVDPTGLTETALHPRVTTFDAPGIEGWTVIVVREA